MSKRNMAGPSSLDALISRQVRETHPMERLNHKPSELFGLMSKGLVWEIQVAIIDNARYTIIKGKSNKFKKIPDRIDRGLLVMRPPHDETSSTTSSPIQSNFCMPSGNVRLVDTSVRGSVERIITEWTGWELDDVVASLPEVVISGKKVVYTYIVTVFNVSSTNKIEQIRPTGSRNMDDFEWLQSAEDIKNKAGMLPVTRDTALLAFEFQTKHWNTLHSMIYIKAVDACEHKRDYDYSIRVAVVLPQKQNKSAEPSLLLLKDKETGKWRPIQGPVTKYNTQSTIFEIIKQFVFDDASLNVNKIIASVQDKPRFIQQENELKQGAVVLEYLVSVVETSPPGVVKYPPQTFSESRWSSSLNESHGTADLATGCKDFFDRALPLARKYVKFGEVKFNHNPWAVTLPDDEQPEITRVGPSAFKAANMEGGATDFDTYFDAHSSASVSSTLPTRSTPSTHGVIDGDVDDDEDAVIITGVDPSPPSSTAIHTLHPAEAHWSAGYVPSLAEANATEDERSLGSTHFPVLGAAEGRPNKPSSQTAPRLKKLTQRERRKVFQQTDIHERPEPRTSNNETSAAISSEQESHVFPADSSRSRASFKKSGTDWFDDDDQKAAVDGEPKQVEGDSADLVDLFSNQKKNKMPAKADEKVVGKGKGKARFLSDDSDSDDLFPSPSKENQSPSKGAKTFDRLSEQVDAKEKERKAMQKSLPKGNNPGESPQQQSRDIWALGDDSE
jgi:hypothetical protein